MAPTNRNDSAKRLLEEGRAGEAARLLAGATDLDGLAMLSEAHLLAGDVDAARAAVEQAVRLSPGSPGLFERWMRLRSVPDGRAGGPTLSLSSTLHARPASGLALVAEAGRGGTAVVYEARDALLARSVALKVYHRPREQRAQLIREVDVTLAVAGPGVARLFDADASEGWLQLEWASGGAASQRVPVGFAWVAALVRALARVHRAGWVHGDVKPANVLFDAAAAPLLSDFGLAVRPGDRYAGATAGFVSRERESGRAAALDDDVYALGCTLRAVVADPPRAVVELVSLACSDARPADAGRLFDEAIAHRVEFSEVTAASGYKVPPFRP